MGPTQKMADGDHTFAQARTRLEEIVSQVRKKDTTLEKSLDLLEEGVRLANQCTELSDHTEWRKVAQEGTDDSAEDASEAPAAGAEAQVDAGAEGDDSKEDPGSADVESDDDSQAEHNDSAEALDSGSSE